MVEIEASDGPQMPTLLWNEITASLNDAEVDEVRSVIGGQLIQSNLDLAEELSALLEILRDFSSSTDQLMVSQARDRKAFEPPVRDILQQEIFFFIDNLRQKARDTGRRDTALIPSDSQKDIDTMNYILQNSRPTTPRPSSALRLKQNLDEFQAPVRPGSALPSSRPGSARLLTAGSSSRPSSGRSSRHSTLHSSSRPNSARPSTAGSSSSSAVEVVEEVKDKLDVYNIDEVVDHIRTAFSEEHEYLGAQVEQVRLCIEDEAEFRQEASNPPPSIQDMREFKSKVETAYLKEGDLESVPVALAPPPPDIDRAVFNQYSKLPPSTMEKPPMNLPGSQSPPRTASPQGQPRRQGRSSVTRLRSLVTQEADS